MKNFAWEMHQDRFLVYLSEQVPRDRLNRYVWMKRNWKPASHLETHFLLKTTKPQIMDSSENEFV